MLENKQDFEYFIKSKLAESGLTITKLASLLKMSQPNLSKKIKNYSLTYCEVNQIAKILNYQITWIKDYTVKKNKNNVSPFID